MPNKKKTISNDKIKKIIKKTMTIHANLLSLRSKPFDQKQ